MFLEKLGSYFKKYNSHFSKSLLEFCESMFMCCSSNSWEVARKLSAITNTSFKAAEMRRYRLLSNKNFIVDDSLFRCNLNMLYDALEQSNSLKNSDKILIAIDYTSNRDKYLILSACFIIGEKSYPIYHSVRNYPKSKARFDQKKLEKSFMKSLKHLLSKRYSYVIVADRGFGNDRFFSLCEELGFEYLIRILPNMKGKYDKEIGIVRDLLGCPGKKNIHVTKWDKSYDFYLKTKDDKEWFMVSNIKNMDEEECATLYAKRFKIEKIFQNFKSSGFDLESSKIDEYSKFNRLLFCCSLCYNLLILLGKHINDKMEYLKKNSSICENLILAYLVSQDEQCFTMYAKLKK